jgi:ribosomal protein S18 acetylase RimI-like enzyme
MNKTHEAVKITKAQEVHIPDMAQCHIKSFPGRFMTEMGHRWLCALYRFFISHNGSICQVAVDTDDKVIGLAVGGEQNIREEFLSSTMFHYLHLIFWKFLSKQLVRRVLLQELAGKLSRKYNDNHSVNIKTLNDEVRSGNLLSICVLPDYEGTGVAGRLIESFQLACKAEGYQRLTLSVDKENSRAVAFYKKHGWRQSGINGESIRFVLDL